MTRPLLYSRIALSLLLCALTFPLTFGCGGGGGNSKGCKRNSLYGSIGDPGPLPTYPPPPPLVGRIAGAWQGSAVTDTSTPMYYPELRPPEGPVQIVIASDGTLSGTARDTARGEDGSVSGTIQDYVGEQFDKREKPSGFTENLVLRFPTRTFTAQGTFTLEEEGRLTGSLSVRLTGNAGGPTTSHLELARK